MEFIHNNSTPATVGELDLFQVPPTQTVVESIYDVEYRPVGMLNKASMFEFVIPASEHYTDLSATYLHAKIKITTDPELTDTDKLIPVDNYGVSLFEQLDIYLGTINITPGNSLLHYQSHIDDLFFRYKSPIDTCQMLNVGEVQRQERIKKEFDLILPIHAPMFQQEKFLIDGVPMMMRFKLAPSSFGLFCSKDIKCSLDFQQLSLFIRRVKLFSPVQMTMESNLAKSMVKYYFQRNEVKSYHLMKDFAANSIENVYNGQLPRKVIVGFVTDDAFNGKIQSNAFNFEHKGINSIAFFVNGVKIPSSPYKPDFKNNLYMREYYNMYRAMNQDFGIPKINIKYTDYATKNPLFVFDLSDDGTLTNDSGALSLIKRGNARIEIQFTTAPTEGMHMIVFGVFDSVLQIDSSRNVTTDY